MQEKLLKDLRRATHSARLDTGDAHADESALERMNGMMQALSILQEIDVDGVAPLYTPTEDLLREDLQLRLDEVCDHIDAGTATQHSEFARKGLFVLPKMID